MSAPPTPGQKVVRKKGYDVIEISGSLDLPSISTVFPDPSESQLLYNQTTGRLHFANGSGWNRVATDSDVSNVVAGNGITIVSSGNVRTVELSRNIIAGVLPGESLITNGNPASGDYVIKRVRGFNGINLIDSSGGIQITLGQQLVNTGVGTDLVNNGAPALGNYSIKRLAATGQTTLSDDGNTVTVQTPLKLLTDSSPLAPEENSLVHSDGSGLSNYAINKITAESPVFIISPSLGVTSFGLKPGFYVSGTTSITVRIRDVATGNPVSSVNDGGFTAGSGVFSIDYTKIGKNVIVRLPSFKCLVGNDTTSFFISIDDFALPISLTPAGRVRVDLNPALPPASVISTLVLNENLPAVSFTTQLRASGVGVIQQFYGILQYVGSGVARCVPIAFTYSGSYPGGTQDVALDSCNISYESV